MISRPLVVELGDDRPRIHPDAWVAPGAVVVGNVELAARVGVYYGAVLRAEEASISVGTQSNVQDNCVLHAGLSHSVRIGDQVTIGHSAVVHGCTVEDGALVGMGSILLNDCVVGAGSLVAAGTLVPEGAEFPPGSLLAGRPARLVRRLSEADREELVAGAVHYLGLLDRHRGGLHRDGSRLRPGDGGPPEGPEGRSRAPG